MIIFQLVTEESIPEILEMMKSFNAIDNYPFNEGLRRQNLKKILTNDNLGRLWVIRQSETIIGYVVLAFGFSFEYGGRDAFIDEFFLIEDARSKGIGQEVMKF